MKEIIKNVFELDSRERNTLLCKLATKEHLGSISLTETIQLQVIQAIRKANGEIDAVLKSWEENPDLDPRNEN